jgi:hypothetical protein
MKELKAVNRDFCFSGMVKMWIPAVAKWNNQSKEAKLTE